jgi:hypothetical protein
MTNTDIIEMAELSVEDARVNSSAPLAESARIQLIININRLVSFVFIISFIYIVIVSFFKPMQKIPDIIQNTFSLTLGYFGSALITFLENKSRK